MGTDWTIGMKIADKRLWLGEGVSSIDARVILYHFDGDQFELFTSYAQSVPVQFRGTLGECVDRGETFIAQRKAEGWREELPSYNK